MAKQQPTEQQTARGNSGGSFDTGYGNPPKHTQFRKGVSGNPKGRPKGRPNVATVIERVLFEKVVVREYGLNKSVTKLEAALKQVTKKATTGDLAAIRLLTTLAGTLKCETADVQTEERLSDADLRLMNRVLERLERSRRRAEDDTNKQR